MDAAHRIHQTNFDFLRVVASSLPRQIRPLHWLPGFPKIPAIFRPIADHHADNRGNPHNDAVDFGATFNCVLDLHFLQTFFVHLRNVRCVAQSKRCAFHHFRPRAAQTVDNRGTQVFLRFEFYVLEGLASLFPLDPSKIPSPSFPRFPTFISRLPSPSSAYCVCRPPRRPAITRSSKPLPTVQHAFTR